MSEENMKQYRTYRPMEQLNTWWVIEWPDKRIATFTDSEASTAERAAKEHADKMNREVAMIDIKSWDEKIYQAQCNVNKVAVALLDMKGMTGFSLKNKDLAAKFDIAGAYNHLIDAMDLLKNAVDELPHGEEIEKALEMLSSLK